MRSGIGNPVGDSNLSHAKGQIFLSSTFESKFSLSYFIPKNVENVEYFHSGSISNRVHLWNEVIILRKFFWRLEMHCFFNVVGNVVDHQWFLLFFSPSPRLLKGYSQLLMLGHRGYRLETLAACKFVVNVISRTPVCFLAPHSAQWFPLVQPWDRW